MTDICQVCLSERIASVYAHSKDLSSISYRGHTTDGYFQNIDNVCDGDDMDITVCLDCGQLQGKWPVKDPKFQQECWNCDEEQEVPFGETICPSCGDDFFSASESYQIEKHFEPKESAGYSTVKIGTTKCRLLVPFEFEGLPHRPTGHEMVVESVNAGRTELTVTFCGYTLDLVIGRDVELI